MKVDREVCFTVWTHGTEARLQRFDLKKKFSVSLADMPKKISYKCQGVDLKKALCAYWLMAAHCSVEAWVLEEADWAFLKLQGKWVNAKKMCSLDATSCEQTQPRITSRLSESTPGQQGASFPSLIRRFNFRKSTSSKQCNFCGARCLGST